jgi:cytochrome P450
MNDLEISERQKPTFTDPAVLECPFPVYDKLLAENPVYRDPVSGIYVVSRFADVRQVVMNPKTFLSGAIVEHVRDNVHTTRAARMRQIYVERGWLPGPSLSQQDEPRHGETRAIFERAFRAGKIKELDPVVCETAYELVRSFADDGACDIVDRFAVPLPLMVIGVQMGVDLADIWKIKRWTDAWIRRLGLLQTEEEEIASIESEIEAQHYFKTIFDRLRSKPDETVLSDLVNTARSDGSRLTDNELFGHIMADTFVGGSETTTNALSAGIMLLARNPEQASLLRSDPDRYLRPFAEEVLRLESPVQQLFRIAAVDAEVGGVAIPAGALVSVCYAAANRDPRQFDCPREMNINRASPGAHLTFGSGIHHCLGAPLARRELYWGFKALIDELDNIQLDESKNDYLHIPSMMLRALNVLHITFDRKHK